MFESGGDRILEAQNARSRFGRENRRSGTREKAARRRERRDWLHGFDRQSARIRSVLRDGESEFRATRRVREKATASALRWGAGRA
jgi:hypothetical protein